MLIVFVNQTKNVVHTKARNRMRAASVRTELLINFNVQALDQMDDTGWVEPMQAFDEQELPIQAFDEQELHEAQVATADNLPIENGAGIIEWQAGNAQQAAVQAPGSPPDDGSDTDDNIALEQELAERAQKRTRNE